MQELTLIAIVVIAVWAAAALWRGGPLAGCLAVLLAATCLSTEFFVVEAGVARLTVDRILWCLVVLLYLVWRRQGWCDPNPLRSPDVLLLVLVGYLALRTFTSDWQANNSTPLLHLVLWYVMPLGVYWVARQSRVSRRESLAIVGCLAVFGVYLAVTVIAEKFEALWLVYPRYIVDSMADKNAEFVGRGRGPLLNPMGTGILLATCWSAALLWWPHTSGARRAALLPLSLLFALAVYATMTRSVWMGAGLSLAVVVGAGVPKNWRVPVLGGAMLAAVLLAATNWDHIMAFQRDRNLTARETEDSVRVRPVLAMVAWNMFQERPWFGCGFDQYGAEHKYFLADRSTELVLEKARGLASHNVLLAMLTETGLVGLVLFLAVLVFWARDAWRLWRAPAAPLWARQHGLLFLAVLAAYLVNGMFHHVVYMPVIHMLLFFMGGLTAGPRPGTIVSTSRTGSDPLEVPCGTGAHCEVPVSLIETEPAEQTCPA
jgi:O-antigen ligase